MIPLQQARQPSIYHTAAATICLAIIETARRSMSIEISSTVFGKKLSKINCTENDLAILVADSWLSRFYILRNKSAITDKLATSVDNFL